MLVVFGSGKTSQILTNSKRGIAPSKNNLYYCVSPSVHLCNVLLKLNGPLTISFLKQSDQIMIFFSLAPFDSLLIFLSSINKSYTGFPILNS